MAKSSSKSSAKKASSKRTTLAPNGDKRYIRRDDKGRIAESDDVGRSLSQDKKRTAKTVAKPGQGDKGDLKKSTATKKTAGKKSSSKKG